MDERRASGREVRDTAAESRDGRPRCALASPWAQRPNGPRVDGNAVKWSLKLRLSVTKPLLITHWLCSARSRGCQGSTGVQLNEPSAKHEETANDRANHDRAPLVEADRPSLPPLTQTGCYGGRVSRSVNTEPPSSASSTRTLPPCASAMCFTRERPMPEPRTCLPVDDLPRTKRSKMRLRSSAAMPGPRSMTATSAPPGAGRTTTATPASARISGHCRRSDHGDLDARSSAQIRYLSSESSIASRASREHGVRPARDARPNAPSTLVGGWRARLCESSTFRSGSCGEALVT